MYYGFLYMGISKKDIFKDDLSQFRETLLSRKNIRFEVILVNYRVRCRLKKKINKILLIR